MDWLLALLPSIIKAWESFQGTNTLANYSIKDQSFSLLFALFDKRSRLFGNFVRDKENKLNDIDCWGQFL
jgi:hypothetical protein